MKDQYNELFEGVHLSETAKEKIRERETQPSHTETKRSKGRMGIRAAVLVGIVFLGSTGIFAATHLPNVKKAEKQHDSEWQVQEEEDRGFGVFSLVTNKPENKTENKPEKKEKSGLYDVKLNYIPKGFKQDKEDKFFYRKGKKDENGFFSVILYRLKTDYTTLRASQVLETFETEEGQGYITGHDDCNCYITMLKYDDVDYMVQIDGSNMPKKEVLKIAKGATLYPVKKKEEIQASYIVWTKERQKEKDRYIEKIENNDFSYGVE